MEFDSTFANSLRDVLPALDNAASVEADGFWVNEIRHDPFLSLSTAASHISTSERFNGRCPIIGTGVAVALARSPMLLAQNAWDLAAVTNGRFWLGLGSQIKSHIEGRFGMPWGDPLGRMREYVLALRAIWESFQTSKRLRFSGRHYRLDLMTPFFNPGPIAHPKIPIGLAAVGPKMARLAGEVADFVALHPFCTLPYLQSVLIPAIQAGLESSGRPTHSLTVVGAVFVISGDDQCRQRLTDDVRQQIAFYGSTPAYAAVLAAIGQENLAKELHRLSLRGRWPDMLSIIDDAVLKEFAVCDSWDNIKPKIHRKFGKYYHRTVLSIGIEDWRRLDFISSYASGQ